MAIISSLFYITAGVPQGSDTTPGLNIYTSNISTTNSIYVDDSAILSSHDDNGVYKSQWQLHYKRKILILYIFKDHPSLMLSGQISRNNF